MTTPPELSALIPSQPAPPALHADDIHVRWVMPEIFHDLPSTSRTTTRRSGWWKNLWKGRSQVRERTTGQDSDLSAR